jgi:hypothetical protein
MNIVKALPADTIIGNNHGIGSNSNYIIWGNNFCVHGRGVPMRYLDSLWMLLQWARDGWEIHPLLEFEGWV